MSGLVRGCGKRVKGGIYAETAGIGGLPLSHFLIEPPTVITPEMQAALGIGPLGVKLLERDGVWHILDWVGESHYPNLADFVEEADRFGASRRLPKTLEFAKLTAASRLILLHPRASMTNWLDVYAQAHKAPGFNCPKNNHTGPAFEGGVIEEPAAECIGLWWETLAPGTAPEGMRTMPSCTFPGREWTEPKPDFQLAIFASLPIARLAVINDPEGGTHLGAIEKASASSLPVQPEDE